MTPPYPKKDTHDKITNMCNHMYASDVDLHKIVLNCSSLGL